MASAFHRMKRSPTSPTKAKAAMGKRAQHSRQLMPTPCPLSASNFLVLTGCVKPITSFFRPTGKNDVIGLTQPVRTRKLLADNGHGVGINCRECCALLPIAAFAFVGDVGDLFIR